MDPEQVYQEVLKEEQGKGVSGAVAEGRAKAARVRAEHGSPHPKEAKWWPGSQPHLEEGAAEAEVAEEPAAEAPAEETAPAEEPAPEAPVQEAPAPAEAPAPEAAPAPTEPPPAEPAPAPAPAAAEAPAVEPAPAPPVGVTHGTPSGTRLRPEDAVTTQSQFDAQQAVYERRKLIDELVSSGTPAVTAEEAGRPRAPFLALLYVLIPLIAILVVVAQDEDTATEATGAEATEQTDGGGGGGGGGGQDVTAENIAFDQPELTFTAGESSTLTFQNNDSGIDHNVAIYNNRDDAVQQQNALFDGEIFPGVDSRDYEVPALDEGDYYFQCDVHPNMNGDVTVE